MDRKYAALEARKHRRAAERYESKDMFGLAIFHYVTARRFERQAGIR
jgi:hypothetical protein